jgi:hypothetical protein
MAPQQQPSSRAWRSVLLYAVAACALLTVFSLYTRPDFMLNLANQVWSCF